MALNKKYYNFGTGLIMFCVIVTVLLWSIMLPLPQRFVDTNTILKSIGQLLGLIGTVLFALSFVLMTRIKAIEEKFYGLDKMYSIHHILGALSFIFILFHPLVLVTRFIPQDLSYAVEYFIPANYWPINVGIIALYSMILLLALTFFVPIAYKKWRISHKFLGFVYIIACFHFFVIPSDITNFAPLYIWMMGLSLFGIGSFIYGSFLRTMFWWRVSIYNN